MIAVLKGIYDMGVGKILGAKNILIAAGIALPIGVGVGWYYSSKMCDADRLDAVVDQRKDDVETVKTALKAESKLQEKLIKSTKKIDVIRQEVKKHEIVIRESNEEASCDCSVGSSGNGAFLNGELVRMLNDARADVALDSAPKRDAKSATVATPVTLSDFVDDDLRVTGLYNDLAIRHNELVSWVEAEVEKHNKRILNNQ